ncbi:MAG: ExeM/NucH family extracellular endonuclease [Anaerolineae bacterium]|nr:ExeM/NucH family extracellular endonuclease [Anaerolineae bacterium]
MKASEIGQAILRVGVLGLLIMLVAAPVLGQADPISLNEMQVSTTGTDWEFFEIQGTPGTSLDNTWLIGIESDTGTSAGTIDRIIDLSGQTIPADGFFVGMNATGTTQYGITPDLTIVENAFENGTASYFLVTGFSGSQGTDLDADNAAPLDTTPWASVLDSVTIADSTGDVFYAAAVAGPDGTFLPSGVYRCPDAPSGTWQATFLNFDVANGTPGYTNAALCGGDVAPQVTGTTPGDGASGASSTTNIDMAFSESVTTAAGWYAVVCTASGDVTADYSNTPGSGLNQTLTYTGPGLVVGETCTVTLTAALITDEDGTPDPLAGGDYVFSFSIAGAVSLDLIHDIQGSGSTSPQTGSSVTVEAIVTGDFQTGLGGFFIQEEDADADADPLTSEGVFVFDNRTGVDVSVGDLVHVAGSVAEFNSSGSILTELGNITEVTILSSGNPLPSATPVTLPVSSVSDWERYEGMRVTIPQELTVTEHFQLGRFGQLTLSQGGRQSIPTQVTTPGSAANDVTAANDRHQIVLDDGSSSAWPDPVIFPAPSLTASRTVRGGDSVPSLSGILDDRFGAYRIQPLEPVFFTVNNPRSASPNSVGGSLKVASFNVLNYFTTIDPGTDVPRGADSTAEFERQRAKIISALSSMNADVVGLIEIENNPSEAVADLVSGLNDVLGTGTYDYIDTGVIGTDAIRVALIYKPAAVTPLGDFAVLDSSVDPQFLDDKNRPALAQTFKENATNGMLTVVVNHLKSKGSDCNDVGDPDLGDGQGNCNGTRTLAAQALVNWLATDPTNSGDSDVLLIGDMNSYANEDPIQAFLSGGFVNLVAQFIGPEAYSYVFDGEWGYLDHALANGSLAGQVTGVTEWHINADEPNALDYNDNVRDPGELSSNIPLNLPGSYSPDAYRSSDHDPVLVGLNLTPSEVEVVIDIRPLIPINLVNLNSGGQLPVAIFSAPGFDAGLIDVDTVILAGAPAAPVLPRWPKFQLIDINRDGLDDLLVQFEIQALNLAAGDTQATLTGETLTGLPFIGTDQVIVIPRIATRLLEPRNGEVVRTSRPLFRWVPYALNTCYQIQINNLPFTAEEQSALQEATVVTLPWYRASYLSNGTYFWRVRVGGTCDVTPGPWSEVWSFTVQSR